MLIDSTFNVTAEDDEYNQRKYTFTRYSPEINDSSRIFFQCGCANNPYKYNSDYIFYINNASYETPKTDNSADCNTEITHYKVLYHQDTV